jgi:hypothetical protein
MAGLWTHHRGHPYIYLLLLATLIAIVLLLVKGDTPALSVLAG